MDKKKAFVFDTNFIIQNKNLNAVFANLSEQFTVYVTQISIDERISQQRLDAKQKFDALPQIVSKYRGIAKINETTTIEKEYERIKTGVQKNYTDLFGESIIPFSRNDNTFPDILHRVYEKQPPFVAGESDRGFKDTLLWLSLLDFFKTQGESDVVFVTDDKGFRNSTEILCTEFKTYTGKELEIKDNSYYNEILNYMDTPPKNNVLPVQKPLPDVNVLRDKIQDTISAMSISVV